MGSYISDPVPQTTRTACAGASAAYVIRQLAIAASRYAPNLERAFIEALHLDRHGATVSSVFETLKAWRPEFGRRGLSISSQVVHSAGAGLIRWVAEGLGRRGAVVTVEAARLYPGEGVHGAHAVALVYAPPFGAVQEQVGMMDPWPDRATLIPVPATMITAASAGLLLSWTG